MYGELGVSEADKTALKRRKIEQTSDIYKLDIT